MDALATLETLAQNIGRGSVTMIDMINVLRGRFVESLADAPRKTKD